MGIHGLPGFLQSKYINVYKKKHLSHFENKSMAIDVSGLLYKYIAATNDKNWLQLFINLIYKLKYYKILPIFVFDGPPPIEKYDTGKIRNERFKKSKLYLNELNQLLERKKKCVEESFEDKSIDLFQKCKDNINIDDFELKYIDINCLENKIISISKQCLKPTKEHISKLQELLKLSGIPFITSNTEAELHCAFLHLKKGIDYVWSADYDTLNYGIKYLLTSLDKNFFIEINYNKVLTSLNLTHNQFNTFCIMNGCDYNNNIKGYGPVKNLYLVSKYKTFEDIQNNINVNTDCLKFEICMNRFDIKHADETIQIPFMTKINKSIKKFIYDNNINFNYKLLKSLKQEIQLY